MARARSLCCLVAGVLLIALIAGCGGGSGGGPKLSGGFGKITGSVSELPLDASNRAPGSPITVAVDGTDISTLAGSDGSFILDRVPIGMHTLVAHTSARACAVVVNVEQDQETTVGEMVLSESGQISGLITDATSHEPIAGASVAVTEMVYDSAGQMPHPVRMRRTDANGSYTISALPAGEYLVTISKDGYATCSLDLTVNAGATTPGDASLAKSAPAETGALTGAVYLTTDSSDPRPVPGVLVRLVPNGKPIDTRPLPGGAIGEDGNPVDLYPDDGISPPPVPFGRGDGVPMPPVWFDQYYTYTDENGAYTLDGVPAGQYTAVAVRPGLQPARQAVTITANQTATLNFTMALVQINYGTITGTVTDDGTNTAIQGAIVRAILSPVIAQSRQSEGNGGAVILPDPIRCIMITRTDENGHYTLKVPTSVQAVIFGAEGYERKQVDVQVELNGTVTVDAALAKITGGAEYTLQGRVMIEPSATGEPVPAGGATVTVWPAVPQPMAESNVAIRSAVRFLVPVCTATADESGNYSLVLPPGEYLVAATKDYRQSEIVTIQMNENKTRNLLIPYVADGGEGPPPPPPM